MRSADVLGSLLIAKISDMISLAGDLTPEEIMIHDGLKTHIIEDPYTSISISSEDSFKVEVVPVDISAAILRDYYYGYLRANQQWSSTKELLKNDNHIAWAVVTSYYCAFFCAIEILRLQGKFLISLAKEDSEKLFSRATGIGKPAFLSKNHTGFVGTISKDFTSIEFKANGAKPHQFAWIQMSHTTFPAFPKRTSDWIELERLKRMCKGDKSWEFPSDIRNRWNYRDANFFSSQGKKSAFPFLKILTGKDSATGWITDHGKISSENDAIASLATMVCFLQGGLEDSYMRGFLSHVKMNN